MFKPCWTACHGEACPAPLRYLAVGRSLKTLHLLRLVTANFSSTLFPLLVNSLLSSSLLIAVARSCSFPAAASFQNAAPALVRMHTDASLLQPGAAVSSDVSHTTRQHLGQLPDLPAPREGGLDSCVSPAPSPSLAEDFLHGSDVKESACNAGDTGQIPGSRRFPGEGNDKPTPIFLPDNLMDRGAWWATVHRVTKSPV